MILKATPEYRVVGYSCIAFESRQFFKRILYLKQINVITGLTCSGGAGAIALVAHPLIRPCWGRRMIAGHEKVTTMSQAPSSIQYICFRKASGSNMGAPACFLLRTPFILVTPLSIRRLVPSRNSFTHFYVAKLRCRQTADSRTALATALKLVSRFQFGRL